MLKNSKEYLVYTLSKREAKVRHLHWRISILKNSIAYLEPFLKEKEYLIRTLRNKISVSENEPTQSSFDVIKLRIDDHKLNDIINSTKSIGDK